MAIKADEITTIIKSAIDQFDAGVEMRSVGTVVEVGDGIAQVYGLEGALASELLEFPGGVYGMPLNLEEETVARSSWVTSSRSRKATRSRPQAASSRCP